MLLSGYMIKWIYDHLPHIAFSDMVIVAAGITTVSKLFETLFNKKFIGTWVINAVKTFFLLPIKTFKVVIGLGEALDNINKKVDVVHKEVLYNGGSSVKDMIKKSLYKLDFLAEKQRAQLYLNANPVFVTDGKGFLKFANAAWLRLMGCDDIQQVLGKGWLKTISDDDLEDVEFRLKLEAETPSPFYGEVLHKNLQTGETIKTRCRTQLIKDSDGNVIETLGVLELITSK